VEKGLSGAAPSSIATYAGLGNMYFNSVEDFGKAFGPHSGTIMGVLPNFTNIEPTIQIIEVVA
jgi:uncharacterized protein (TIGR02118 family)